VFFGLKKRNLEMARNVIEPEADKTDLTVSASTSGSNNHGERIAKYSELKKNSLSVSKYLKDKKRYKDEYLALTGCANYLVFHEYYTIDQIKLAKIKTCKKHMLCEFCASKRASKSSNAYLEKFLQVKKENPKLIPALLTLTVKNKKNFEKVFNHLVKSFGKYKDRRRDYLKRGTGFNEFCKIEGAAYSYEITKSDKGFHPHIHMVVMLNDYIDVKKLSEEWLTITKDSKIVDIRKLKGDSEQDLTKSFLEVFKYSLKFSDFDYDTLLEVYSNLRGKRLQGSFGCFYGVKVPESDIDELFEDLPYLERFYKFSKKSNSFSLESYRVVEDQPDLEDRSLEYTSLDTGLFIHSKDSERQVSKRRSEQRQARDSRSSEDFECNEFPELQTSVASFNLENMCIPEPET
jgi:hypothetical protein